MALDPSNLRPGQLLRLLNSTPAGAVASERRLRTHRQRAGLRIGGEKTVDLVRYCAWLVKEELGARGQELGKRDAAAEPPCPQGDARGDVHRRGDTAAPYEKTKADAAARSRSDSDVGRDIGPIRKPANPKRRARAEGDLRFFLETYFPETFNLAWSPDHLEVISVMQQVVLTGGKFTLAMPRGSGKTSLSEEATLWAALGGHRPFTALIGSDKPSAIALLDSIKTELETNDLLADDWPEVCDPIRELDGITQRIAGQHVAGEPTRIRWSKTEIVLPTVAGSKVSGAKISTAGITGGIRGIKFKRADGSSIRPSLVILDDPQTDASARSDKQVATRRRILLGAVMGLAGPKTKIAAVMPCTVVRENDLADEFLDRKRHPDWQGRRFKMVYKFPSDEKLWEQYAQIRRDDLAADGDGGSATDFYRKHRKAMDAGAHVAWPELYNDDEISAIQHAQNLKLDDEIAFFAEYQNEPLPDSDEDNSDLLTADQIAHKLSGYPRGLIPVAATKLTGFIDVHRHVLYWGVAAWSENFTGWAIDYGSFPDQKRAIYSHRDVQVTLGKMFPGYNFEEWIYRGLDALTKQLCGREWPRDDGSTARIDRLAIDANWDDGTNVVKEFCRTSQHASLLLPSHGRGITAANKPLNDYQKKPGDRLGTNWRIPRGKGQPIRHVLFDTNFWKSFFQSRLSTPIGGPGSFSLFGKKPAVHTQMSLHLTAEFRVRTEGRGRVVYQWKQKPGSDNHGLDVFVGTAVLAAVEGCEMIGVRPIGKPKRKGPRRKLSEVRKEKQQAKRAARGDVEA